MTSRCRHPGRETSNEATTGGVAVEGAEDGKSDGLVRGAVDKAFLGEGRGRVRPVGDGEPVVERNHVEEHSVDAASAS
jgi:hypothetical protein